MVSTDDFKICKLKVLLFVIRVLSCGTADSIFAVTIEQQFFLQSKSCMCRFAKVKSLVSSKDFKAGIAAYNKLARTLAEFQVLWHTSWLRSLEAATSSLHQSLLIAHPETGDSLPEVAIQYSTRFQGFCPRLQGRWVAFPSNCVA